VNWRSAILALTSLGITSGVAPAQAQKRLWRVGFLSPRRIGDLAQDFFGAFPRAMRELGYVEGETLVIEWRSAEGREERLAELAAELVRMKVDVIVAAAPQGVRAAQAATSVIPIVMGTPGDPVAEGFVRSLARPGGNTTGTSTNPAEVAAKRLEMLVALRPKLKRAAVLWNPTKGTLTAFDNLRGAAQRIGVGIMSLEVRSADEFEAAFRTMKREKTEGLLILQDQLFTPHLRRIADLALQLPIPSIASIREYVEAGGLASYGPSFVDNYRQAAVYVDKILKGAKPADLPIAQPLKYDLFVNARTAKTLGVTIPQTMLISAEKVIDS
jgi:putative ABC transport system substrate-binding protein